MKLSDIKRYRGYMPMRMEREDVLSWLGRLIGGRWLDGLWLGKYGGYHEVRYRFGDVQEAQMYMKDGTWLGMKLELWLKFSEMDASALDDGCWKWIMTERARVGAGEKRASVRGGGLLDL